MSSVFAAEHTRAVLEVIREIETDPTEYLGAKYMPAIEMPTAEIFVDVWQARGGLVKEHTLGTDPRASSRRQFRTQQFSPGYYKEFIRFNEGEILKLRELGINDQSKRGIRQHLEENAMVLNNRIEARMELLRWQAILNGTYTYDGQVISFGKPSNHDVAPTQPWGANDGSGNFTTTNASATPIQDVRYWTLGGYAPFRKYKIKKIVMNPNTARMFLDNPAVQSLIQNRFAAETYTSHNINAALQFLVPGCPEVEIYDGWYQNETEDVNTGLISVTDAVFFIPDGRMYFETKLPGGDNIGDVCMTLNLSSGSIDNPVAGKFLLVDEHIADRPGNPYIDLLGGFHGGPRLKRGFDVLTATVI